jgi:hypothetical protein
MTAFNVQVSQNPYLARDAGEVHAVVSIASSQPAGTGAATGARLAEALIVDTSGSMGGEKIHCAIAALETAINLLHDDALFCVIAGSDSGRVVVHVDPSLYGTLNPDAPTGRPDQTFSLFETENIVGRATPAVRVHVPISQDAGVSRRHAVLLLHPDRGLSVRDLGSANVMQLNGVELLPGVETPLKHGDVLAIGAWTRLTIRGVNGWPKE